ncbi:EAL and HDOD domain-containing protein [Hydrogenimonas sp.]
MDTIFIARQPIVTDAKELYAHELLFRDFMNDPDISDTEALNDLYATSRVAVNVLNQFGINRLTGDKWAFINADARFILSDFVEMLPKDRFVIEILEDVRIEKPLVERVEELRNRGFRFAVDDIVLENGFLEEYAPILPFIDILKVDIRINEAESVERMIRLLARYSHLTYLAEKVETLEEYELYKGMGFTLFQGYFFARPEIRKKRSLDPARRTLLELSGLLADDASDMAEIAAAFERAPDLSLQLLQFLNSAHFGFGNPIRSIGHAVMIVGKTNLLTWLYLLAYANIDTVERERSPLVALAGFRSQLLRRIAKLHGDTREVEDMAAFMGTLSLAEKLFEMPMARILEETKIDETIKMALLGGHGTLARYLEIVKAVEEFDAAGCMRKAKEVGLSTGGLERAILESYAV